VRRCVEERIYLTGDEAVDQVGARRGGRDRVPAQAVGRERRVGGATYQVPYEVDMKRRLQLALRWIKQAAVDGQDGEPIADSLARELMNAANDEGVAVKRREQAHKMADANKAFAHFAR
jgi:ribosomal protein S7